MYKQSLVEVIEPVKKTTISRLNKGKKWKYGYDKEHDIIVISKTGQIGEILEVQNLPWVQNSILMQGLRSRKRCVEWNWRSAISYLIICLLQLLCYMQIKSRTRYTAPVLVLLDW